MSRVLAVIPARSGSKGLKDKNIRSMCGKPLLAYTIEAARDSKIFDCIHVSTDSELYADIAREYGADVPFLRPQEYATDQAATWDVVRYVTTMYEKRGEIFDIVVLLQPTTPLRRAVHIIEALELYHAKQANAVVSVCETEHSPLWTDVLPNDFNMKNFVKKEIREIPRQELPIYYRVNGAIYIVNRTSLFSEITLYENNCYAYVMSNNDSVDIDTELDFQIAEVLLKGTTGTGLLDKSK